MHLITCGDRAETRQAEDIKLSGIRNTSSNPVCRDSRLVEIMKEVFDYLSANDLEYGVKYVDVYIKDIVDDTLSSEYLPSRTRATYMQHLRLATW